MARSKIFSEVIRYVSKNYQWVIVVAVAMAALLVAIFSVPWNARLASEAEMERVKHTLAETKVIYFTPAASVDPRLIMSGAKCNDSNASNRTDSFRCYVQNTVLDPCFHQEIGDYMDCPKSPTDHQILSPNESFNVFVRSKDPTEEAHPWYVLLDSEAQCKYYTGATYSLAGARVDYVCDDKTVLLLPIDTSGAVQKIRCYNLDLERIESCKIQESWY